MRKSPKIKVAQIGVGYWGPNLLRNLMANSRCQVKTVVDISEERRKFVASLYPSVQITGNIDDVISDDTIDAVVIATPVNTHYDLCIRALSSCKHVLVEKPMATIVNEIDHIGELAKENNLVAMVGHTFLYNAAVRYIKKLIDSGELGDIQYIYSQRLNLGRIRGDVDALWNLAPHDISIIQYWLNELEPLAVCRRGMSYVQDCIDDVVFLNITYPRGVLANIHVSWLDPHKIRKMTIVGSQKMVVYNDIADNKIAVYDKGIDRIAILGQHMDFDDPNTFSFSHRNGNIVLPKIKWIEPLKAELDHFIDCVQNEADCLTDYRHAGRVVKILEMCS